MEQDQEKINTIIQGLKKDTGADWSEAVGFFVAPSADSEGTSTRVNLNSGMIQKAFVNPKTGEIRYYWIEKIKKDS